MNDEENKVDDNEKKNKKHLKLPNVLEPSFVAPDGGWGWMIVIASGFSNFCTLSVMQSFGLIFRDRFQELGISVAEATTISNINNAVNSCIALTNGPLYRRYSCRQVACFGAFLSALSVCALSFMSTFHGILMFYSIFYAIGNSLCMTSCSLSLNTYFEKKRRTAVCLSWTCTGLAPIIIPQIITALLPIYDVSGTVLLFGGMMFNAVACALLLQPVSMHAKKESDSEGLEAPTKMDIIKPNFVDSGNFEGGNNNHTNDATVEVNKFCENTDNNENQTINDLKIPSQDDNMTQSLLGLSPCMRHIRNDKGNMNQTWYMRALHAVSVFFDLDLLRDPIYVNIMMGVTLVNFADINAFILMPFILSDNLSRKIDVANIMSVLAIVDVMTRLAIPFIATSIGWENRTYYIVAMTVLAISRMLLAYVRTYDLLIVTAFISGAGKAFRQVFVALVIPSHVPLERLAAANGLQLTAGGIIFLAFGPIVGRIRDICGGYTMSLHFLNGFTYLVMICWVAELCYAPMKKKRLGRNTGNSVLTNLNACQLKCPK